MTRRQQPSMQPAGMHPPGSYPPIVPTQDAVARQHAADQRHAPADAFYAPLRSSRMQQSPVQYPDMPDVAAPTHAEVMLRHPQRAAVSPPPSHRRQGSAASAASAFSVASGAPDARIYLDQQQRVQQTEQQEYLYYQPQQQQYQAGEMQMKGTHPAHKRSGSQASAASDAMTSPFATHSPAHSYASSAFSQYHQQHQQQQVKAVKAVWSPRKPPQPFRTKFAPLAFLLFVAYLAALGYYSYVRVAFTLSNGVQTWYAIVILAIEAMGVSAVIPYGFLLFLSTHSSGSRGLPVDDGVVVLPQEKQFHVRVLVPCYKEAMSVVMNTVNAALEAELPGGVARTVYLCDDGRDPEKEAYIAQLGPDAVYVSGRTRKPGEINGKSANVNNCLRNVIYPNGLADAPNAIPITEVVVVFDADMVAKRNFFLKVLEVMWDETVALCLTPQAFSNISPYADIFNNINLQFWSYVLPGCDAWGYIACTGTNFCIRSKALATVGWFPEYTITEDYALSMELKAAGFKGRYLDEFLAVGEAPDEVRNVMRQRSRWTKGHMQIFFSWKYCPLLRWRLPLLHKILYTNGTWAYFSTIFTTVVFVMVPFNSLVFNWQPVAFTKPFVIAATIYLPMNFLLMNYVTKPSHLKGLWFASISNHILAFTYMKAVVNTLLSIIGLKAKAGFKATEKSGGNALSSIKRAGAAMMAQLSLRPSHSGQLPLHVATAEIAPLPLPPGHKRVLPRPEAAPKKKRGCWMWVNAKTLGGVLDPIFLMLSLLVSLAAIAAGVYKLVRNDAFNFSVQSFQDFKDIFGSGKLDVYTLVPMLWAAYNAIPPLLFFVYFFTKGPLLKVLAALMQLFGLLCSSAAIACLWVWFVTCTNCG